MVEKEPHGEGGGFSSFGSMQAHNAHQTTHSRFNRGPGIGRDATPNLNTAYSTGYSGSTNPQDNLHVPLHHKPEEPDDHLPKTSPWATKYMKNHAESE